jgi:hypothetical protein
MGVWFVVCASTLAQGELVTQSEVAETAGKTETIFRTVLKLPAGRPNFAQGAKAATRTQILASFWTLYSLAKPKFTFSLPPVTYDPKRLTSEFKGDQRKHLESLIRDGFVAPYGPLSTGTRTGLTITEYGDALGMFIARTMERTHMPSTAWSPYIQGPGGPPVAPKKKDG